MIIDYSRYPVARFLNAGEIAKGETFCCEQNKVLMTGMKAITPYGVKESVGEGQKKGFFKKSKPAHLVKDETKKGIAIRSTHYQSDFQSSALIRSRSEEGNVVSINAILDKDLLMPQLIEQPKSYEELKMLILTDPRFLKQVVPSKRILDCNDKEQLIDFMETMEQAVEEVLYSQIDMGVVWNKEEQAECEGFKSDCIKAHEEFIKSTVKNVLKLKAPNEQESAV